MAPFALPPLTKEVTLCFDHDLFQLWKKSTIKERYFWQSLTLAILSTSCTLGEPSMLITIQGKNTERVHTTKLLGVTITSDLTWGERVD